MTFSRFNFYPIFLVSILIFLSASAITLYPKYKSVRVKSERLSTRLSNLSKGLDSANQETVKIVTNLEYLLSRTSSNSLRIKTNKVNKTAKTHLNSHKGPIKIPFKPTLEIYLGHFSSYDSAIAAYTKFRGKNEIDCKIIELVTNKKYLLVFEYPKQYHPFPYTDGYVIKLDETISALGARPIYIYSPNEYKFVDGKN